MIRPRTHLGSWYSVSGTILLTGPDGAIMTQNEFLCKRVKSCDES